MTKVLRKKSTHNNLGSANLIVIIAVVVALVVVLSALFASYEQRSSQHGSQPQATVSVTANQPDQTVGWKVASSVRSKISFTFKYPSEWNSPYDHCNTPPASNSLELSANCIKTVIITENIPDENTPPLRDVLLTSQTPMTIGGYDAKRQIYSLPGEGPDTYLLWVYYGERPIMLYIAWIGSGTNSQTRQDFVREFDGIVSTFVLHRQ